MQNNRVTLSGLIQSQVEISHTIKEETFLNLIINVKRTSGTYDKLPIIVSEKNFLETISILKVNSVEEFNHILLEEKRQFCLSVQGEFRTHNRIENGKNTLLIFIFAKEITFETIELFENTIYLDGHLCKEPIFRMTPSERKVCDLIIAVNRNFKKSDYIPAIAWNDNALILSEYKVGMKLKIEGRFQSRIYKKVIHNISVEKTAYEVSINKIL